MTLVAGGDELRGGWLLAEELGKRARKNGELKWVLATRLQASEVLTHELGLTGDQRVVLELAWRVPFRQLAIQRRCSFWIIAHEREHEVATKETAPLATDRGEVAAPRPFKPGSRRYPL